ncbi:hypothetical protein AAG747_05910 [Rapidithrix thailandica]|uniref:Uncharacterized protein n=1 Tax=Rapidithrix thailandica TaxID=413964 RepID=A0AAW9S9Q1_9BACT
MMIIWSGLGFLVAVIPIVLTIISEVLFARLKWALSADLLLAAIVIWCLAYWLNIRPGKVVVDNDTGQKIELKAQHTFLWIKMQYWAYIFAGISWLSLLISLML